MSGEELTGSERSILERYENQLRAEMPEDCIPKYKKFLFCKVKVMEYLKQKLNPLQYSQVGTFKGDLGAGCVEETNDYLNCQESFLDRYNDLKNYVAIIENKPENYVPGRDEIFRNNLKKHALSINPGEVMHTNIRGRAIH